MSRLLLFTVGLITLLGFTWWLFSGGESGPSTNQRQSDKGKPVSVHTITKQALEMTHRIPGRVVAYRMAEIRPQVGGIILERLFKEGSFVKEGQQLYQIDPERFEANYQMAEANVQTAQAELTRAKALADRFARLIEANAVSAQEYDDASAALAQAKAALARARAERRTAQINLNYTKVYAPISGYIGPSAVTEGALVSANQAQQLAIIRQLDPVYVDLSQPGNESRELKEHLIEARSNEAADKRFEVTLFLRERETIYPHTGTIDATEQAVDEATGSIRVRSVFPNPDVTLLPGMFVQATVADLGQRRAMLVPHKAVTIQPSGEKAVWVISGENTAEQRMIETGQSMDNQWVVLEGLAEGERVVIDGAMHLKPGDSVQVKPPQETAQP